MLIGLLTSADPYAIRTSTASHGPRRCSTPARAQVQKDLADEPGLQAEMLTAIGARIAGSVNYDRSQQLLEEALRAGQQAFGPEHPQVAQTLDYLGVVLADKGDYVAAGRTWSAHSVSGASCSGHTATSPSRWRSSDASIRTRD